MIIRPVQSKRILQPNIPIIGAKGLAISDDFPSFATSSISGFTRRQTIGTVATLGGAALLAAIFGINPFKRSDESSKFSYTTVLDPIVTEIPDPGNLADKEKALRLIDQLILDIRKNKNEVAAKTVNLLERYREHFKETGYVTNKLYQTNKSILDKDAPTECKFKPNISLNRTNGIDVKVAAVFPKIHTDMLNEYWKFRNNPHIRMHFASNILKDAAHIFISEKSPNVMRNWVSSSYLFGLELKKAGIDASSMPTNVNFIKLAGNTNLYEAAQTFVVRDLHVRYLVHRAKLEFLYRQNFGSFGIDSFVRGNKPSELLRDNLSHDQELLKFVSGGVLKKDEFQDYEAKTQATTAAEEDLVNLAVHIWQAGLPRE